MFPSWRMLAKSRVRLCQTGEEGEKEWRGGGFGCSMSSEDSGQDCCRLQTTDTFGT